MFGLETDLNLSLIKTGAEILLNIYISLDFGAVKLNESNILFI